LRKFSAQKGKWVFWGQLGVDLEQKLFSQALKKISYLVCWASYGQVIYMNHEGDPGFATEEN